MTFGAMTFGAMTFGAMTTCGGGVRVLNATAEQSHCNNFTERRSIEPRRTSNAMSYLWRSVTRGRLAASLALLALFAAPSLALADPEPRLRLEVEGAPLWQTRNDLRIPNDDTADEFSLVDVVGKGPTVAGRLYLTWNLAERHGLRALLAPLTIEDTGLLAAPTRFAGSTFAAGVPTGATYRFNSWRLGYRYRIYDGERWTWRVGFTAKVRDAEVELRQPGVVGRDTDIGFVPLAHISASYRVGEHWAFELDADALAGGPGRAEDVSVKLRRRAGERWSLAFGYRMLEGGANVDSVFSFAWLHYGTVSLSYDF